MFLISFFCISSMFLLCTMFYYGSAMVLHWFWETKMICKKSWIYGSKILLSFYLGSAMWKQWFYYGSTVVLLWFYCGTAFVLLCYIYSVLSSTMILLWFCNDSTVLPLFFYAGSSVFLSGSQVLWFNNHSTMNLPWFCNGVICIYCGSAIILLLLCLVLL